MNHPADPTARRCDEIDDDFVLRRRDDIDSVEIEGELVLTVTCEGSNEQLFDSHWLDRPATIIWNLLDGQTTLGELAEDLAEVFGVSLDRMRRDVLELARTVGRAGLLEGVIAERPFSPPPRRSGGLPVGTPVPPFQGTDFEGQDFTHETLRDQRTVLVNWSPGCGYCSRIVRDLAAAAPQLAATDHELVLVASGSDEENRRLVENAGLACTIVSNDGFELFEGLGTPVAYIVDETGCLASDLATGAIEVMELVGAAAGGTHR